MRCKTSYYFFNIFKKKKIEKDTDRIFVLLRQMDFILFFMIYVKLPHKSLMQELFSTIIILKRYLIKSMTEFIGFLTYSIVNVCLAIYLLLIIYTELTVFPIKLYS